MKEYENEQEKFWSGEFGDEYINRNKSDILNASNLTLFSKILKSTHNLRSIAEYGCNIGMNLKAIRELCPVVDLHGYEINKSAISYLADTQSHVTGHHQSILEKIDLQVDLTFTKGVLIHIQPDNLPLIYDNLYRNAKRYILVAEYYDPNPVSLKYRGHENKMFKRDFAGELLDTYKDLRLLDYGFCYHRDPLFPQDDITWFLLEK
jgi:pseudaminic acid biosynthesis-associated methylase